MSHRVVLIGMALVAPGLLMCAEGRGGQAMDLGSLLPKTVGGWSAGGRDRVFTRSDIFDYINGAGEIYLAYDFQRVFVREYTKPSAPSFVAEIYQLSSSEDAYGIFSHDRDGEALTLGQGAIYAAGLLRFWQDRIFVRLMAENETPEAKAALLELGRRIVSAIPRQGKRPQLLACLPREGLVQQSVHYFHTPVSLNAHYYLADSNLLNLSEKTDAILARYRIGAGKPRLLLCRYKSPQEAISAFEQFNMIYFRDRPTATSGLRVEKVEKSEFVSARRERSLVVLVFESPDRKTCEGLTAGVLARAKEVFQW